MHANGPRITQHPRSCQTPIKAHGSQLDKSIHVSEADVCVNMTSDEVNWKQLINGKSNWLLAFQCCRFVHYICGAGGATYRNPSGRLRVSHSRFTSVGTEGAVGVKMC